MSTANFLSCTFALLACVPAYAAGKNVDESQLAMARKLAASFNQQLTSEIIDTFTRKGPDAAWLVCRDRAPELADSLSRKYGWRVSRVSLKPRNIVLGTADAWEQRVLNQFEQRAFLGESAQTLEFGDMTRDLQGHAYRYMKALVMQKPCLACHGTPDTLAPSLKSRIKEAYPHDRATGYRVGQVAGAITIYRPLHPVTPKP
mgnify:CR=1 FL=1